MADSIVHVTVAKPVLWRGRHFEPGEHVPLLREELEQLQAVAPHAGVEITRDEAELARIEGAE